MEPRVREYKIVVWIKGRAKPLTGIRRYLAYQAADVHSLVNQSLLKYYFQDDILKNRNNADRSIAAVAENAVVVLINFCILAQQH